MEWTENTQQKPIEILTYNLHSCRDSFGLTPCESVRQEWANSKMSDTNSSCRETSYHNKACNIVFIPYRVSTIS